MNEITVYWIFQCTEVEILGNRIQPWLLRQFIYIGFTCFILLKNSRSMYVDCWFFADA